MPTPLIVTTLTALVLAAGKPPAAGNRLAYLDENSPYHAGLSTPRLTTPQWVGEPGVEAVVVLAIDDLQAKDVSKYEAYLRPILKRLEAIDGRAPVSIMTRDVKPDDPQAATWIAEGVNLDVHTLTHAHPLLQNGDFKAARDTTNDCLELLKRVPLNHPVAFRMPYCDSLNTPSPRFFAEIFNATTLDGSFLAIDSSVFTLLTPADPALPRRLVTDPDGGERFRKYLPFRSFVNTVENYPYPYVIGRLCWEFPCAVPSDWEAQNLNKPSSPKTLEDLEAALDAVVAKQGVFDLVFHPHGWIKPEQVVALIDHAVTTHGRKVKFLNFAEALERIDQNLLAGVPLRHRDGRDHGVRILDVNNDGYMDVVIANERVRRTRVWQPRTSTWSERSFPVPLVTRGSLNLVDTHARFGVVRGDGQASVLVQCEWAGNTVAAGGWSFHDGDWHRDPALEKGLGGGILGTFHTSMLGVDKGVRFRDIDGDGRCELICWSDLFADFHGIFRFDPDHGWTPLPFGLPGAATVVMARRPEGKAILELDDMNGHDAGLRFVDLDEDGQLDVVFSNDREFGIFLFDSMTRGWSRRVTAGKAGSPGSIPPIVRVGGAAWEPRLVPHGGQKIARVGRPNYVTDNGFWVHSRSLWWQNEDTTPLPDHVDRRSFNDLLKDVNPRGKSAAAAARAIRVRPGFQVELAASEPLVLDPIGFDWSADGRLWVLEMGDYPLGLDGKGKPGGQVRVLEDTDGDGRYDKVTVFLDGLGFPSGMMPWRKGVLVGAAPDIFYAEDRDGDGKADHREVLFTGFHPGNQQHRLNGFELGLDGWVYGANGDSGGVVRSLRTGKTVDIRGRDFRFKPDTGEFETESGMTQYGRHRDDWGRWFGNNNPTWGWLFMLAESELRRNPSFAAPDPRKPLEPETKLHPVSYTAPRFNDPGAAGYVTSANSPTPYRDDLLGPHFASCLFVSEPVHNLVHLMLLEPDGPGLKGRRAPGEADREFLASSDAWFRPTMLKTGPDGALWIADMDRAVIEHPEWIPDDWEAKLDLRAGSDLGRIFRVVPVDRPARPIPRLDQLDREGLYAALDSPNGWQRDTAQRLLLHQHADWREVRKFPTEGLERRFATFTDPRARVQALWVLQELESPNRDLLLAALGDPHPQVRRNAVRLMEPFLAHDRANPTPRAQADHAACQAVARLVDDRDASVRFQVALSLGVWDNRTAAGQALAKLARRDGADPWFRAAILVSAPRCVGPLLATLFADGAGPPPAGLVEPLFALAGVPEARTNLVALLDAVGKPAGPGGRYSGWQFSALTGLLDAARRAGQDLSRWVGAETKDLPALQPLYAQALAVAVDPKASEDDRIAAIGLFGRDPRHRDAERSVASELLKPQVSSRIQLAALGRAAASYDPKIPEVLLAGWKGHSPSLRTAILDTLLSRPDWAANLLVAIESSRVAPSEIDPAHRSALLAATDPKIRDRARSLLGTSQGTRAAVLASYREAISIPGNPAAGAAAFKRVCATCHKLDGVGSEVGPDLAQLSDHSPETLLTAILDPNRAVESKYTSFTVHLVDGRALTGLIASETAASITLRRQDAKDDLVPRAEIEEMAGSGLSLMPEGLEKDLTKSDVANLIAYLGSSGPPPKSLAGNHPVVVSPQPDGTLLLPASAAEIRGSSLTFEMHYGNLGFWTASNDRASWRFEGARPGRYEVWLDACCDDATAGQTAAITVGSERVEFRVPGTGNWDHYRPTRAGIVTLPASGRLDMFPAGPLKGPLIDLRKVELRRLPSARGE